MTWICNSGAAASFSHLVEAATALAQLNVGTALRVEERVSSPSPHHKVPPAAVVEQSPTHNSSTKREIFPQSLLSILNDKSLSDIVTWLPHGRSFVIIRPDVFTEKVLPKYFAPADARASTKYPSFTRKLNRWGFRQATRGPDTGAFHHPLFCRDMPELCLEMVCQRSRDRPKGDGKNAEQSKKKRSGQNAVKVAPLTEASIEEVLQPKTTGIRKSVAVVSVADDSHSESSSHSPSPSKCMKSSIRTLPLESICSDLKLVQETLRRRDDMERLSIAKAMLYDSYLKALGGK